MFGVSIIVIYCRINKDLGGIFNEKNIDWHRHYISFNYCILSDSTYNWMDVGS